MSAADVSLTIVHYHRFRHQCAREWLDAQCRCLREMYDVVAMQEAAERLNAGRGGHRPMAVVCVDDGHQDFRSVAFPVFVKHEIPAIGYLATDFVDGVDWLWCDAITYLCRHSSRSRVTVHFPDGRQLASEITTAAERSALIRDLKDQMKGLPNRDRLDTLDRLPDTFGVPLPARPPHPYRALNWDDARHMTDLGMSFGVHTRTHPILSRLEEADVVREIVHSKNRFEAELGVPARHFCYPNGRAEDIGARTPELLRAHGFITAVTTVFGVNDAETDRMRLHRIWMEPEFSLQRFRARLAGARGRAAANVTSSPAVSAEVE